MVDTRYCGDPDLVVLMPGAADGLRALASRGYSIVVVTNQSGIGRGYFDLQALEAVNSRLATELESRGASYDALYYCPHLPDERCACRKPRPEMLLRAAADLNLDLTSSYMVGDRGADIEAGQAAGVRTILISGEDDAREEDARPDFIAHDLIEAAQIILSGVATPGGESPCVS